MAVSVVVVVVVVVVVFTTSGATTVSGRDWCSNGLPCTLAWISPSGEEGGEEGAGVAWARLLRYLWVRHCPNTTRRAAGPDPFTATTTTTMDINIISLILILITIIVISNRKRSTSTSMSTNQTGTTTRGIRCGMTRRPRRAAGAPGLSKTTGSTVTERGRWARRPCRIITCTEVTVT